MSRVSQLFDLQQIDTNLDRRAARLREIEEQMADTPALLAARDAHKAARAVLSDRQAVLKHLTHEAEDTAARVKQQEVRLYNGSVKNPKELAQIQEEVSHLKSRLRILEDEALDAMMLVEEAENSLSERTSALDAVTKEWEQFQAGLLEEKDTLSEQSKVLQVKRQKLVSEIVWADLQVYERMRRTKGGLAIAGVQDGSCGGCRVGVPVHVLRAARTSPDLTLCPSCGRILYPTAEVKFREFDHDLDNINR